MSAGLGLGTVVGILSGVWLVYLLRSSADPGITWKTLTAMVSSLVAIPVFMLGGTWGTATILQQARLDFSEIRWYLNALTVVFVAVVMLDLVGFVRRK